MSAHKIRILIVDDHAIVREGLKRVLADVPDMIVAGETGCGNEALRLVQTRAWDMVLLDISLPKKSGLDVLKHIKAEKRHLPVLILSMYPEDQYALRLLKAGAAGYLTKESAPERLVNAIRKVACGGRYLSPALADKLADALQNNPLAAPHETLSDREFQIMCLIAMGKTPTQIAEELHLSVKTVSTYRSRILEKMDLQSSAELTHYAVKNSLVV